MTELRERIDGDEEQRDGGEKAKRTKHLWILSGLGLGARYLVVAVFASNDRFFEKNGSTLVSTRSYTLLVWSPSYSSYVCLMPKFVKISSSCLFDLRRPSLVPTSMPIALYIFRLGMY